MAVVPFKLTDRERAPDTREIKIEGELDLAYADQLEAALERAADYRAILVDLSECEFIDSTGLAVFVHASVAMRGEGRRLALVSPSSEVWRTLEITGLTGDGLVFGTAEAAIAAALGESPQAG